MLQWLSGLGNKVDHPMYNVEEARRLLAELPPDNGKAVEEISASLETVAATPGFPLSDRIGVIKLLDETGQKREAAALSDFLRSTKIKEFERLRLWQVLVEHWERLSSAYRVCLKEIAQATKPGGPPHPERALLVMRALRALANEGKMLHLRYLPVKPRIWQELAELYSQAEKEQIVAEVTKAYATDLLPTNARQEFLRLLMMDAAGPESERMLEMELSARVVARMGSGFAIQAKAEEGCNFCFDLARPGRPVRRPAEVPANATLRCFGVGRAGAAIQEIIDRLTANPQEPEKRFGDDFPVQEKLVVLKRLLLQWGESPPKRHGPRVKIDAKIKVAHGFPAASELVTRIEFSGMAEMTEDQRLKVKKQTGIALQAQEATAVITEWVERDGSNWGIGVDVPRQDEPWARIGTLIVFQAPGHKSWWVGAIRRISRDPQDHMHAGIEIVSKKPLSVYLRGIGEGAQRAENWQTSSGSFQFTYVNAVILGESETSGTRHEILVAREQFNPGIQYEVMMGEQTPHVRLDELLERGEDYDCVRVTWLKGQAQQSAQKASPAA
ncbi:MAG: hypothetical protein HYU76_05790 [Betaproteobacteria bacterium]|nr:hypothetical protein [Betaproteobacteria bacterium]